MSVIVSCDLVYPGTVGIVMVMVRVTVMILEQEMDSILHLIHVKQIVLFQVGIVMVRVTVMILEQEWTVYFT